MSTGWHAQRARENRVFPPPKAKAKRARPRRAPKPLPEVASPGNCQFCGNCCWPDKEWRCHMCGVVYPAVSDDNGDGAPQRETRLQAGAPQQPEG